MQFRAVSTRGRRRTTKITSAGNPTTTTTRTTTMTTCAGRTAFVTAQKIISRSRGEAASINSVPRKRKQRRRDREMISPDTYCRTGSGCFFPVVITMAVLVTFESGSWLALDTEARRHCLIRFLDRSIRGRFNRPLLPLAVQQIHIALSVNDLPLISSSASKKRQGIAWELSRVDLNYLATIVI